MNESNMQIHLQQNESFTEMTPPVAVVSPEQLQRSSAYNLLASLLRAAPDKALLQQVAELVTVESADDLATALSMLGMSAGHADAGMVDDEYHALFIGLGRGELVPFGAWYQTGFLMERPLSALRDDLKALGFERDEGVSEPEDHVAALCEVMAMLIADGATHALQTEFFNRHLESWFERFFTDLVNANHADFYLSVGRLGLAFTHFEKQYLAMQV